VRQLLSAQPQAAFRRRVQPAFDAAAVGLFLIAKRFFSQCLDARHTDCPPAGFIIDKILPMYKAWLVQTTTATATYHAANRIDLLT
jgi:hypothetical protein